MANFTTTYDLKLDALRRCGEVTNGNSPYDSLIIEYLNGVNQAIISGSNEFNVDIGDPWNWAKAQNPGVIVLIPPYNTGSVTLTNGLTTGSFSVAPSVSQVGNFLKLDGRSDYFRIVTHVAASTSFTIDVAYTDTTVTSTFNSYKLDYDLTPGIQRLIQPMTVYRLQDRLNSYKEGKIFGVDLTTLETQYPLINLNGSVPTAFAVTNDVNGQITVRFNTYVLNNTKIEYEYIPIPSDLIIQTFLDAAVTTGTDLITISAHGFTDGMQVQLLSSGTLPAGLSANTTYFIVSSTATTFKLSTTLGGSAVDITAAAGGGTHTISNIPIIPREFRQALSYLSCYWLMVDKNDDRAPAHLGLGQGKLKAMLQGYRKEVTHVAKNKGKLLPRQDLLSTATKVTDYL